MKLRAIAKGGKDAVRVGLGALSHLLTKRTPPKSYDSFVALHCATQGRSTDLFHGIVRRRHAVEPDTEGASTSASVGAAGTRPAIVRDRAEALRALDRDGVVIFPDLLPADVCDRLVAFGATHDAELVPPAADGTARARWEPDAPRTHVYRLFEQQLLTNDDMAALAVEPTLVGLAAEYLSCAPILGMATMWWSAPRAEPSSEAAQLFHFDLDRLRWLKVFVYLTDVTAETGPHTYVKGTHKRPPADLLQHGYVRLADDEVVRRVGRDAVLEVTGPRGTVFAADTRGFHRGKVPTAGPRLVCELEYSSSLFGAVYARPRVSPTPRVLAEAARRWPRLVERLDLDAAT